MKSKVTVTRTNVMQSTQTLNFVKFTGLYGSGN